MVDLEHGTTFYLSRALYPNDQMQWKLFGYRHGTTFYLSRALKPDDQMLRRSSTGNCKSG